MCFVAGTPVWTASGIVPIEAIKTGDLVWSRSDKNLGTLALKRVIDTIVTRPESLNEIKLDLDDDGKVDESIKGTPEHPFWVEEIESFVAMGDLVPGQTLRLVNGTSCSILSVSTLRGPPRSHEFTYNLEVEGFHTYFVGNTGVWVHNATKQPCEKVLSIYRRYKLRGLDPWEAFSETVKKLKDVPAQTFGLAAGEAMEELYKMAAAGQNGTWPSHTKIRELMSGRNTDYNPDAIPNGSYFGLLNPEDAPGVWRQFRLESHHGVPEKVQKWLQMTKNVDDSPALLTTFLEHMGKGVGIHQTIARKIGHKILPGGPPWQLNGPRPPLLNSQILEALQEAYDEEGLGPFWQVCRMWTGPIPD